MTNIILASVIVFLIKNVISNKELLSKFHQHGYKIKDVRIDLNSYDSNTFNFYVIKAFKYNRTIAVHNVTWNFKVDVKDELEAVVQVHKFLSNEYRHFPVRFQVNAKKGLDSNALGLKQSLKCGNMTDFYFYKEVTYHVCNFYIDETQFPPLIPNGKYQVVLYLMYHNKEIAELAGYGEVYTPMEYPKK